MILWFICIAVLAFISISFIKDFKKIKNSYFFWISLFFLLLLLARIFRLIVKFSIGEPLIGEPFLGAAFFYESMFLLTTYVALFFLYFALERNILKKTHFIFSILVCILCVVAIFNLFFYNTLLYVALALFVITIAGLPIIFFNLAIKTSGGLRKNSLIVAIGAILAEVGLALDIPEGFIVLADLGLSDIALFLAPVLQIIGYILIKKGFPKVE